MQFWGPFNRDARADLIASIELLGVCIERNDRVALPQEHPYIYE